MTVTKVSELPINYKGAMVYIDVVWNNLLKVSIGNKYYTINKPRGKKAIDLKERESYIAYKIKYLKGYRLEFKMIEEVEAKAEEDKIVRRSNEEIKNDFKEGTNEFYAELEQEVLQRKEQEYSS